MSNIAVPEQTPLEPSTIAARSPSVTARVALIAAVLMLLAPLFATQAAANPSDEASFVAQVNQYRASLGLPALQVDGQLTSLARGWAAQMRDGVCGAGNHICHANPISAGVTHDWAKLGENVGTGGDVDSVMQAFLASEGHRNNIKDPEFTHIGVGVVWKEGRLYTTHRFMSLRGAAPTTTTTAPTTTAPPVTTAAPTTSPPTTAPPATAPPATAPPTTAPSQSQTETESDPTEDQSPAGGIDTRRAGSPPATEERVTIVFDALIELR